MRKLLSSGQKNRQIFGRPSSGRSGRKPLRTSLMNGLTRSISGGKKRMT